MAQSKTLILDDIRDSQISASALWSSQKIADAIAQSQGISSSLSAKSAVRVVATTNIALTGYNTLPVTVDGVGIDSFERVLLTGQTNPAENGIYTLDLLPGGFTRAIDADSEAELLGAFIPVLEGTHADSYYILTTDAPITVGTTALNFQPFITGDIRDGAVSTASLWSSTKVQSEITAAFAATKALVDGLSEKDSVRLAVDSNIDVDGTMTTLDGLALGHGDRVLVFGQTNGGENGIYEWDFPSQTLGRTSDADSSAELEGAFVPVQQGTYADTFFILTTDDINLGVTPLVFTQFAPSVNLSSYAQKVSALDLEVTDFTKGVILKTSTGVRVRLGVEDHPDIANTAVLTMTTL